MFSSPPRRAVAAQRSFAFVVTAGHTGLSGHLRIFFDGIETGDFAQVAGRPLRNGELHES